MLVHFKPHRDMKTRSVGFITSGDRLRITPEVGQPSRSTCLLISIRPPWDRDIHRGDQIIFILVLKCWLDVSQRAVGCKLTLLYLFVDVLHV